jgi:hypothetical protein
MARKKTYTAAPEVPAEMAERYQVILGAISGAMPVAEAARRLGMSRNHFQTLMHRGLGALMEAIQPKAGGRPKRPERQSQLESELERLRKENTRLKNRVETTDRMLEIASGFLRGRIRPTGRQTKKATEGPGDEEPDGERRHVLGAITEMKSLGLRAPLAHAVAGISAPTASRWRKRQTQARSESQPVTPGVLAKAAELLTRCRGLIGADALRASISGLSRRQAAKAKQETMTLLEAIRRNASTRITITQPGVVRGMDAMYVQTTRGMRYLLPIADASVPYRTSCEVAERYDARAVAGALDLDFLRNGAPLVLRLDRAKCHSSPEVQDVLERYRVLSLQGPAYCARFYGQLERQNREHRAWLETYETIDDLASIRDRMVESFNDALPRRTLGWRTARQCWIERPRMDEDRAALRREVEELAARLVSHGLTLDLARRLAISRALQHRGYLRREIGGWC